MKNFRNSEEGSSRMQSSRHKEEVKNGIQVVLLHSSLFIHHSALSTAPGNGAPDFGTAAW